MADVKSREDFVCPHCHALYKVVRVKQGAPATYPTLHCVGCGQPLPSTDGENILKYFRPLRRRQKRMPTFSRSKRS